MDLLSIDLFIRQDWQSNKIVVMKVTIAGKFEILANSSLVLYVHTCLAVSVS